MARCNVIAPLSSQSTTLAKATVTQAIRQVVLCKDRDGKCGVRLHSVNNGVFVCYVGAKSPAALAGLRFGDQILEINNVALAGMTMDQCHALLKKAPTNGITMAVRDRLVFVLLCTNNATIESLYLIFVLILCKFLFQTF